MAKFIVYDTDGAIVRTGHTQSDDVLPQATEPGETAIAVEDLPDDDLQYVSDGSVIDKPSLTVPDLSVDTFSFTTPLPEGTIIEIRDNDTGVKLITKTTILDEVFDCVIEDAGDYSMSLIPPFPYRSHTVEFTV